MTPMDKKRRSKQTKATTKPSINTNFDDHDNPSLKSPSQAENSSIGDSSKKATQITSSSHKKGNNIITLINPLFVRPIPGQNQQPPQIVQEQPQIFQQEQQKQQKTSLSILIPQSMSQQMQKQQYQAKQLQPSQSSNGLPLIPLTQLQPQQQQSSVALPTQNHSQIKLQIPKQVKVQQKKKQQEQGKTGQASFPDLAKTATSSEKLPVFVESKEINFVPPPVGQNQRLASSQGIGGLSQQSSQSQQISQLGQVIPKQNQTQQKGLVNNSSQQQQQQQNQVQPQPLPLAQTPSLISVEPEKPRKKYKNLVDSDSDDELMSISIKKKKVHIEEKPTQPDQEKLRQAKQSNTVVIPVPPLNINKSFQEVLQQTSKEASTLTLVRNILSSGSKKLADKQIIFKKKWNQLRNSNCSHEEYLRYEEQIKSTEDYEIKDIKEITIQRLINSKIRGFTSQEQLIEKGKKDYLISKGLEDDIVAHCREFVLDEKQYEDYRNDQFKLLEKLMRENNLVSSSNNNNSNGNNSFSFFDDGNNNNEPQGLEGQTKTEAEKQLDFLDEEENSLQRVSLCKYFENKKSVNESEQQNENNNMSGKTLDSTEIEKNIEKYALPKIFQEYDEITRLKQGDTSKIAKRVRSLMIGGKSEELFTDVKFLKEQFDRYQQILKKTNDSDELDLSTAEDSTISELIETAAYIMNNVHYFQKFDLKYNLKCDLLHPLDLVYVADKFLKSLPGSRKHI